MGLLDGRVGAVAREFSAQGMANTLWAYATMGREPGERVMGLLDAHAEFISANFSSQDIVDTRWAVNKMGLALSESLAAALSAREASISSSLSAFVAAAAEPGKGPPPQAACACDAMSVAQESVASGFTARTGQTAATTLSQASTAPSRSSAYSQASTAAAGADGGWSVAKGKGRRR